MQVATHTRELSFEMLQYIVGAPLLGAILLGLIVAFGSKAQHKLVGWIASAFSLVSFGFAYTAFSRILEGAGDASINIALAHKLWTWMDVGTLNVEFAFRMDHLAGVMTLVVTGIGTLIHVYATGYMDHDDCRPRFFCYLNLFLFSMLMLVLGDNLLVMFVGWEGVGLCSYLLIGFWFKEMENAKAGQKAFVVNRIGDAGFLIGIFLIFWHLGTVNFVSISEGVSSIPVDVVPWIAFFLFIGAVGKSAQVPLYVWLPDAMAGPTPVSALIHAATMVTAGIYMICRLAPIYDASGWVLILISVIGTLTAFVAATIALVQNDIKKVLAYSTVSQLGYMFMALGAGAFSYGIYHVVTHAFFKACLFMAAGSVIVGCHHEQDMRHFGGLRKIMPFTFMAYAAATYAIIGLPYGSGFFSKDSILWAVYSSEGPTSMLLGGVPISHMLHLVGVVTAFLTAFYMTRSLCLTFFGDYKGHHEAHEVSWVMWLPVLVLAVPSLGFGLMYGESLLEFLAQWTRADLRVSHAVLAENPTYHSLEILSIIVVAISFALSAGIYVFKPAVARALSQISPGIYRILVDKWRIDELYDAVVVRPLHSLSGLLFKIIDRSLIDATVNGTGIFVVTNGELVRRMHGGNIGGYAFFMFLSFVCAVLFWILM